MQLDQLTQYLNTHLHLSSVPDYSQAFNGLQLQNRRNSVHRIAVAVDAHLPVLEKAVAANCDLLIAHHGMFWTTPLPITGSNFKKLDFALQNQLAVYAAHLPLDGHLELGNSIQLAKQLIPSATWSPFFPFKDYPIGVSAQGSWSLTELLQTLPSILNSPVHHCAGAGDTIKNLAIISGAAGSEVAKIHAMGIDTLITGEGPHWSFTLAEELGMNVIYAGHYATETFGVRALAQHLEEKFGLPWVFIDHPTGL